MSPIDNIFRKKYQNCYSTYKYTIFSFGFTLREKKGNLSTENTIFMFPFILHHGGDEENWTPVLRGCANNSTIIDYFGTCINNR